MSRKYLFAGWCGMQRCLNLHIAFAEVKGTNKQTQKSLDGWDANSQRTTTLCGKRASCCLCVVKMKPQIFRLGLLAADVHTNLSFHSGIFLDRLSNQCLDSRKTRQSGFDFIYLPWDDCVVVCFFLTSESFSIFMEYHSRPCSTGNLLWFFAVAL